MSPWLSYPRSYSCSSSLVPRVARKRVRVGARVRAGFPSGRRGSRTLKALLLNRFRDGCHRPLACPSVQNKKARYRPTPGLAKNVREPGVKPPENNRPTTRNWIANLFRDDSYDGSWRPLYDWERNQSLRVLKWTHLVPKRFRKKRPILFELTEGAGIRTRDLRIKSPLLYQLSYASRGLWREAHAALPEPQFSIYHLATWRQGKRRHGAARKSTCLKWDRSRAGR